MNEIGLSYGRDEVMKCSARATILIVAVLLAYAMNAQAQEEHWGYEGERGPEYWGGLSQEFELCALGKAQSPIDLVDATAVKLVDIVFHYGDSVNQIVNNGHTIQVGVAEGSYIVYNEITYHLLQFHFHHPAEHTTNGQAAPMEAHFVHRDRNSGNLAVVGIMMIEGGEENEAWAAVFDQLPGDAGETQTGGKTIQLIDFLSVSRAYYTYQGSLTTPPCSEIVRWLILEAAVEVSTAQIEAFGSLYLGNARPTQPLGERDLLLGMP